MTTEVTTRPEARGRAARTAAFLRRHAGAAVFVVPVVVYLVLTLLGITTSSVGIGFLREDPSAPLGLQIGQSQLSRSDEFGTESPIWLGQMTREGAEDVTPLSVSNDYFAQLPSGVFSGVVFFDGTLLAAGGWIPHEILFAAKWWLPTLLLFLGLPVLFRHLTGSLRWGYLAAILVALAPATAWWSGRPINTLGFVAAGCALTIYAARRLTARRWVPTILAFLGAGILLARLPSYYQPLAIVIGIPLVVGTAAYLLWRDAPVRDRLWSLGAIIVSAGAWTALSIAENLDAFAAGLSTVYPGDRASTGTSLDFGLVFGATNLGWLEPLSNTAPLSPPELVTAFTVLLLVLVVLAAAHRWRGSRAHAAFLIPVIAGAAFWLSWATVNWGQLGALLPLANRVPDTRAAQGVGYLAVIAFCLFMAQWRPHTRLAVALLAGGLAAAVSAYAGSSLQNGRIPTLSTWMIWVSAIVVGFVVFALVRWSDRLWPMVAIVLAALSLTVTVPPVIVGLGDLRASDAAHDFEVWGAEARDSGTVWASDSQHVDALMMATGTPSLSARQQIGPDVDEWRRLDPSGDAEAMWNRGGLHIMFEWTDDDEVTFSQPVADVVVIEASPCAVAERIPELTRISSSRPLEASCLIQVDEFEWSGSPNLVYAVSR